MKGIKVFLGRNKFFNFVVLLVCIWIIIGGYDFYRVDVKDERPACCYEASNEGGACHYIGAGYSFDTFENPSSGEYEYAFYVFGNLVKSTFTN